MRQNLSLTLALLVLHFISTTAVVALKPERHYEAKPCDYGIIYQEVSFQTRDRLMIRGWFYPTQDTAGIVNSLVGGYIPVPSELKRSDRPYATLDTIERPTIVVCLGMRETCPT